MGLIMCICHIILQTIKTKTHRTIPLISARSHRSKANHSVENLSVSLLLFRVVRRPTEVVEYRSNLFGLITPVDGMSKTKPRRDPQAQLEKGKRYRAGVHFCRFHRFSILEDLDLPEHVETVWTFPNTCRGHGNSPTCQHRLLCILELAGGSMNRAKRGLGLDNQCHSPNVSQESQPIIDHQLLEFVGSTESTLPKKRKSLHRIWLQQITTRVNIKTL